MCSFEHEQLIAETRSKAEWLVSARSRLRCKASDRPALADSVEQLDGWKPDRRSLVLSEAW
jgi:hypothetical protein